ncbi:MAG TPA: D-hexose-6-phosphate mutarotase [Ramlibacter sp.]|nr:D-hexose-6-phosphate mutarotase [Ramlibacter sp.]
MSRTSPELLLRNRRGDTARVSADGAQLLSWCTAAQGEQIYLSPVPVAAGRVPRGGVPICFPQFGTRGPLPKHGFARNLPWTILAPEAGSEDASQGRLQLELAPRPDWPHACRLLFEVRLGEGFLSLQLDVTNTGASTFDFTAAIHTYFAVPDVRQAELRGLAASRYEDALDANQRRPASGTALTFPDEIDSVYLGTPECLQLHAPGLPTRRICQHGFTDTVVWNPGPAKAAALGDMPAADWVKMLCVEAAVVATPVVLAPGARWTGIQRVEISGD